MTVAEAEMPESALVLVALAACDALIYLHYGLMWAGAAGCIATVIGRRTLGDAEGSPVLSALSSAAFYSLASGVLLFPVAMLLMIPRILRSVSDDTHTKDIEEPLITPRQIARKMLKDRVMVGTLVSVPFFMLMLAGLLLVGQSPGKGSRREQMGSVLTDVGILGSGAAYCFAIIPTQILRHWRMK